MRMENFVKNIKQDIEVEIKRIEQQDIDILDKIKQIVGFIQTSLARLKVTIADYQFINPEEEILFFKVRKPQISGLLIFYIRLYQIEKNRIGKSPSAQYKYLKEEYESLKNVSSELCKWLISNFAGKLLNPQRKIIAYLWRQQLHGK